MTVDTKIQYSRMAGRLIDHVANGTTDWADGTMEVLSTEYTDAEQWQREMDCIFKSLPILVGVTQEIPNPGDFRTLEILGIPLLITRLADGSAKVADECLHPPRHATHPRSLRQPKNVQLPLPWLDFQIGWLIARHCRCSKIR